MTEDVAKTVWLALQIGQPDEIDPEDEFAELENDKMLEYERIV